MRLLLVAALSLIIFSPEGKAYEYEVLPRLRVAGNTLQTLQGEPVTLRGVSLCSLSWHDPMSLLRKVTDSEEGWNVNVLRLPVQPKEWDRLGPGDYLRDRLDPAVEECRKRNIYCVIDWHEIADWNDKRTARKLEYFWKIAAPRYAKHPNIMYEIFNEPIGPKHRERKNWLAFRETAQKWVDQVRKDAPETVLLVGSPHWSQMPSFAVEDPLHGENLVYVAHIYAGWKPETWDGLFGDASRRIPLFISEWGWSSEKKNRATPFYGTLDGYAEPLRAYLDERPHISWTAWSYDPECGPAMLGTDREMGDFVRGWLEGYRKKNPPPAGRRVSVSQESPG